MRVAMVTVAWSAVRTKDSYWKALFEHLRKRMKAQKAIIAIARRMLKVIYKVIDQKIKYQEKGINHFIDLQRRNYERVQLIKMYPINDLYKADDGFRNFSLLISCLPT